MHLGFPGGRSLQSSPRGIAVPTLTVVHTAFPAGWGGGVQRTNPEVWKPSLFQAAREETLR